MRIRLILLAAVAAAATYAALLRDERRPVLPAGPRPAPPGPPATAAPSEPATAEPAPSTPAEPVAPAEPVPAAAEIAPTAERGVLLDEGRFALGGWAAAPGHSVVSAVTFHRRLPRVVSARQVALEMDASENVPDGGLVVLDDPGFAPDQEGFTLLLAAADPGPFSAAGTYRVLG